MKHDPPLLLSLLMAAPSTGPMPPDAAGAIAAVLLEVLSTPLDWEEVVNLVVGLSVLADAVAVETVRVAAPGVDEVTAVALARARLGERIAGVSP